MNRKQQRIALEQARDSIELVLSQPPEMLTLTQTELRKSLADREMVITRLEERVAVLEAEAKS